MMRMAVQSTSTRPSSRLKSCTTVVQCLVLMDHPIQDHYQTMKRSFAAAAAAAAVDVVDVDIVWLLALLEGV